MRCFFYSFCSIFLFYSSLSSTGTSWPPLALDDDDDRIGPESFKNDEIMFPEPPEATGTGLSSKSAWSSVESSLSGDGIGTLPPPLDPPLKPPNPPAELPLSAPNFEVMAAIFGWITADSNCWSDVIGTGGSMPAALFFAAFVASNWFSSLVLASRIPSIFYKFTHVRNEQLNRKWNCFFCLFVFLINIVFCWL